MTRARRIAARIAAILVIASLAVIVSRIVINAQDSKTTCERVNDLSAVLRKIIKRSEDSTAQYVAAGTITGAQYVQALRDSAKAQADLHPDTC